jgi:hypothetical protein
VNSTGSSSPQGTGRFRAAGFVLGFAAVGLTLAYSAFAQQTGGAPTPPPTSRPTTQPGKFAPPGTPLTETKPLPAFWKSSLDDIDQCLTQAHKGKVELLCRSAGGRKLYVVSYGPPRNLDSQANYNSACGGGNPAWYVHKPAGTPPTVLLLGPVHGQEVEGIAGLMNLLHLVETGADLRGKSYPKLMESFLRCRVLIVPSGNPDGRSRVPLNGFIGESIDTNSYYGMGTNAAGKLWQWPQVKGHQPLTDVGYLGGYFNDAGVNLMHDDWFGRMTSETQAILDLAKREAIDYGVSLHSHGANPQFMQTDYMDPGCQEKAIVISERLSQRFAAVNERVNPIRREAPAAPAPANNNRPRRHRPEAPAAFNLCSALHHVSGGTIVLYENSCGVTGYHQTTYDQILDLQMVLFEELLGYAADNPVVWER